LSDQVATEALTDAEPYASDAAITVARVGWHPGVVGIVAAKLVERFNRPACVIALDEPSGEGRGSIRTARNIDVHSALSRSATHLVRWGGHRQAAGLTIEAGRVDDFRRCFAASVAGQSCEQAERVVVVDALVRLNELERLADETLRLAPFGPGNAEPSFAVTGARVAESRRVGDGGAHLKLSLDDGTSRESAIAFRMGDRDLGPGARVDVAFRPEISYFRGEKRVELRVHDLWPASR
jgi:single-stranded-DNA-specific exonuclease